MTVLLHVLWVWTLLGVLTLAGYNLVKCFFQNRGGKS